MIYVDPVILIRIHINQLHLTQKPITDQKLYPQHMNALPNYRYTLILYSIFNQSEMREKYDNKDYREGEGLKMFTQSGSLHQKLSLYEV